MKVKELKDYLSEVNDEDVIVISKAFLIKQSKNGKDDYKAILDCPIIGFATNESKKKKRLGFILDVDDVMKCFPRNKIKFFDKKNKPKVKNKKKVVK